MRPGRAGLGLFVLLGALVVAAGCGDSKDPVSPVVLLPGLPDSIPQATTPTNLLLRAEAALEQKLPAEWFALLSADYRFTFSADADPDLVTEYGNTWGVAHEKTTIQHLFLGYQDESGQFIQPVTVLSLSLPGVTFADDEDHPDSTTHYRKAVLPSLEGSLELSGGEMYALSAAQALHLVRGDAAVLAPGQEARSDRWYVRRWVDKATPPAVLAAASNITWGGLRARYHR